MTLFEFSDYKAFVRSHISALPRKGHGEFQRLSRVMRVHPTMVSQIFNGPKNLSLEQACVLSEHFGMEDGEAEYFLGLVELERAGSEKLRRRLEKRLTLQRQKNTEVKSRLPRQGKDMNESEQSLFYSDWYYSATRLLTSIKDYRNADAIAQKLGLSRAEITKVLNFLLRAGLCVEENSEVVMGPKRTHIAKESPFFKSHHKNWRLKSIDKLKEASDEDLFFTAPLTISKKDAAKLKENILQLISQTAKTVDQSPPEILYALNIDLFSV